MSGVHGALGWRTVGGAAIIVIAAVAAWLTWGRRAGRTLAVLALLLTQSG